jgi:hypothetical protein
MEKQKEIDSFQAKIKGANFDLGYSMDAVSKLASTDATFEVGFLI